MKHLLRPYTQSGIVALAVVAVALTPQSARGQATEIVELLQEPSPLLFSSSPGYLGVLVGDVDNDSASKLKLKDVRGAVVTLIDHDAPAGQILKINDVVLELNGQPVEGAEQLRRMLHEIPAGHKITMLISRDGAEQTLTTQMGDQKKIEKSVWNNMRNGGDAVGASGPGMNILPNGDTVTGSSGWRFNIFASSLKVGAMVEPLSSQMAEYLGVASGLLVKTVARKTEADAAGLKAFDVILKVGVDPIATVSDWERALRSNQGKPVQLTILRDKKQQTLTLQVDSKHRSELEIEDVFSDDGPLMAELGSASPEFFAWDDDEAEQMRKQAEALRDRLNLSPEQAEQMRKQAEALRNQLKNGAGDLKVDPRVAEQFHKQAEEMRKQAEALRGSMKDFKVDPKQLDDLKREMDQWQKSFTANGFKVDQKQIDELKKQLEQWRDSFRPEDFQLHPQFD
jgi:serine protease Do